MPKLDLVGHVYGRLTVLEAADPRVTPSGTKHNQWRCICECGNETVVLGTNLREMRTSSCGCAMRLREYQVPSTEDYPSKDEVRQMQAAHLKAQRANNGL